MFESVEQHALKLLRALRTVIEPLAGQLCRDDFRHVPDHFREVSLLPALAVDLDPDPAALPVAQGAVPENVAVNELLFVTALVMVLDLVTGELAYCNAGHEDPFLLAPGSASARRSALDQPASS